MRAFRGFLLTISHFSLSCLFLANISLAENRFDYPSGPNSLHKRQERQKLEESKDVTNRGRRMGLTPVPYNPEPVPGKNPVNANTVQASTSTGAGYPDLRELIKKVNRCVVSIRMLDSGGSWSLSNLGFSGDSNSRATGYGSGFIISSNGHILTNEHVLRHGTQIEVELLDGSKRLAKVLFKDSKNDIALIKIDANNLSPVKMGNSDDVELGEWVVGIGNPYGIGQSIMIGIVSAQKRMIPGSGYPPLIQIDAAMNLGNSGGPLFNLKGEVIGINTILLWKSQGIGFATPINMARDFLERKNYPPLKAASAPPTGPLGPESDHPRSLPEKFNPFDPLWKQGQ